jgi:hypothetical protein
VFAAGIIGHASPQSLIATGINDCDNSVSRLYSTRCHGAAKTAHPATQTGLTVR